VNLDRALFLVWGPPGHGPRSKVFARELGIDVEFVSATTRRGPLVAPYKYAVQTLMTIGVLARRRPRLVFIQSPPSPATWLVAAYAVLTGADYVIDAHSAAMLARRWTRPKWLNRLVRRRAVVTIVTNEHFAEQLEAEGCTALVLRDIPTTFPTASEPELPEGFHALVVNTFNFDEPLDEVLEAAHRLPEVTFHVSGRAERHPEVVATAPPNVRFTGFLADEDYHALMKRADVVMCFTTRDHTMQRGACEALSLGRPIITSDWPLLRTYFHRGTVHVDNTAAGMIAAVEEVRARHAHYEAEIEHLRDYQQDQWSQARGRLEELFAAGPSRSRSRSTKRRHAMVVHAYYPVGETRVQREAAALIEDGVDVDIICLRRPGERRREEVDGVNVYRLPVGRNRSLGVAYQLLEYLAFAVLAAVRLTRLHLRRRYRSVQVHNLPDFLVFSALVPKLTGSHILLDLHDLMPEFLADRLGGSMGHPLVRLVALQERISCAFADSVITVTEGWRQRLIERGVEPEKISVVMNVADPDLFTPRDEEAPQDSFTIVYHGTLTHRYGVDLLVEAVARLRSRVPTARLLLLGDGDYRMQLESAVACLGLADVVEFSDEMLEVAELLPYLRRASVGVVPNRSSVFTDDLLPTKLLEYVALGIPVVVARTPMIRSYFDDDMVEFFTPGDADDLADRLAVLAESPERCQELARAARTFVESHPWESIAKSYVALVAGGR
jgi:glycosyltransferase involved in cell wall biosynthesis